MQHRGVYATLSPKINKIFKVYMYFHLHLFDICTTNFTNSFSKEMHWCILLTECIVSGFWYFHTMLYLYDNFYNVLINIHITKTSLKYQPHGILKLLVHGNVFQFWTIYHQIQSLIKQRYKGITRLNFVHCISDNTKCTWKQWWYNGWSIWLLFPVLDYKASAIDNSLALE